MGVVCHEGGYLSTLDTVDHPIDTATAEGTETHETTRTGYITIRVGIHIDFGDA